MPWKHVQKCAQKFDQNGTQRPATGTAKIAGQHRVLFTAQKDALLYKKVISYKAQKLTGESGLR